MAILKFVRWLLSNMIQKKQNKILNLMPIQRFIYVSFLNNMRYNLSYKINNDIVKRLGK